MRANLLVEPLTGARGELLGVAQAVEPCARSEDDGRGDDRTRQRPHADLVDSRDETRAALEHLPAPIEETRQALPFGPLGALPAIHAEGEIAGPAAGIPAQRVEQRATLGLRKGVPGTRSQAGEGFPSEIHHGRF